MVNSIKSTYFCFKTLDHSNGYIKKYHSHLQRCLFSNEYFADEYNLPLKVGGESSPEKLVFLSYNIFEKNFISKNDVLCLS